MDFGLREWLIIIGLLVIAGILFDGWRRMGGRSKIRFKLDRSVKDLPDPEEGNDLLGPPRIVGRHERQERFEREEPSFDEDDFDPDPALQMPAEKRQPEQVGLDLEEPVPVLLDPLAASGVTGKPSKPVKSREPKAPIQPKEPEPAKEAAPVEEVLVINVIARDEDGFAGSALLQSILESGLRHGEMNIFHRHESMSGNGDVLFSMANALKPGVFDLDEMDHTRVRAVSFFMGLPGPRHPKQALDLMIAAARKLAHELGGDLKDDQRSVLTAQTIEHYRLRIAEFERKHYGMRR
ncbi:cell division protein ZipA [Halopseudomonas pelagia]|uniref:Cell division protein ZipA n=1 Tax=Halopseudomonas pelagia TaxID=553151 RepID=A0AA91Z4C1_9GAMM|nr:cell division protein ZipA [Halopseudomonas pelagia]PCC97425.1 cell division protein ZipA [Halopseudomonas pelagia]QFY57740.1 cell division protein ZipA [Halopseudomonas pelagia]